MTFRASPALLARRRLAWELSRKGKSYSEIAVATGFDRGSLSDILRRFDPTRLAPPPRPHSPKLPRATGGHPTLASAYAGGDSDTPRCPCGARLRFETRDGYTYEACWACGVARRIPCQGTRRYDQRERLERYWAQEDQRVEQAKRNGTRQPLKARSDFRAA